MILDVKYRRRNNIPPLPQTSDRRLEQSFRFENRPYVPSTNKVVSENHQTS